MPESQGFVGQHGSDIRIFPSWCNEASRQHFWFEYFTHDTYDIVSGTQWKNQTQITGMWKNLVSLSLLKGTVYERDYLDLTDKLTGLSWNETVATVTDSIYILVRLNVRKNDQNEKKQDGFYPGTREGRGGGGRGERQMCRGQTLTGINSKSTLQEGKVV